MKASELFTIPETLPFGQFFDPEAHPWDWVPQIKVALDAFDFETLEHHHNIPPGLRIEDHVYIHPSAQLPPYGVIHGPAYIGPNCKLRPGVYIRGNVIAGESCVLGNSCEYKNALLISHVQTPHFNYVGDSILGSHSHLGAGAILSNLRFDQKNIIVRTQDGRFPTNLKKLGALLGEHAEIGCNAAIQPGSILAKKAIVGPTKAFSGYLGEDKFAL